MPIQTNIFGNNIAGSPMAEINTNVISSSVLDNNAIIDTDIIPSPLISGYVGESRKDPSVYIEDNDEKQYAKSFNVEDSAWGTFYRSGKKALLPTLAGIAGGALAVAMLPVSAPLLLTLGAGLAGGIGAGMLAETAGEVISPTTKEEFAQEQADIQRHPTAAVLGQLAPNLLMFSPRSPFRVARALSTLGKLEQTGMQVPSIGKSLAAEIGIGAATGVAPAIIEPMISNAANNRPLTEGIEPTSLITGAISGAFLNKPRYVTRLGMRAIGKGAESFYGQPTKEELLAGTAKKKPIIGQDVAADNDYIDYVIKKLNTPVSNPYGVIKQPLFLSDKLGIVSDKDSIKYKDETGKEIQQPVSQAFNDILGDTGKKYFSKAVSDLYKEIKIYESLGKKEFDIEDIFSFNKLAPKGKEKYVNGLLDKGYSDYLQSHGLNPSSIDKVKEIDLKSQILSNLSDNMVPLDENGDIDIQGLIIAGKIMRGGYADTLARDVGLLSNINNPILHNAAKNKLQDDYIKIQSQDKDYLSKSAIDPYIRYTLFSDKSLLNSGISLFRNDDVDILKKQYQHVEDPESKSLINYGDTYSYVNNNKLLFFTDNNGNIVNGVRLSNILSLANKRNIEDLNPEDFLNAINNFYRKNESGNDYDPDMDPFIDIQSIIQYINTKYKGSIEGNKISGKVDDVTNKFIDFLDSIGVKEIPKTVTINSIKDVYNRSIYELSNNWNNNLSKLSPKSIYDLHSNVDKPDYNTFLEAYNNINPETAEKFLLSRGDINKNLDLLYVSYINNLLGKQNNRISYDDINGNILGLNKNNNDDKFISNNIINTKAKYLDKNITDLINARNGIERIIDVHRKALDNIGKTKGYDSEEYNTAINNIDNKTEDLNNLIKIYNSRIGDLSETFLYHYLNDLVSRSLETPDKTADDYGTILYNITRGVDNMLQGLYAEEGIIKNDNFNVKSILKSAWDAFEPSILDKNNGVIRFEFKNKDDVIKFFDNLKNNLNAEIDKVNTDLDIGRKFTKIKGVIERSIDSLKSLVEGEFNKKEFYNRNGKEYQLPDFSVEHRYNPKTTTIDHNTKTISFEKVGKIRYDIEGVKPEVINDNRVPSDYAVIEIAKNIIKKNLSNDRAILHKEEQINSSPPQDFIKASNIKRIYDDYAITLDNYEENKSIYSKKDIISHNLNEKDVNNFGRYKESTNIKNIFKYKYKKILHNKPNEIEVYRSELAGRKQSLFKEDIATDPGYYGAGTYFSLSQNYAIEYNPLLSYILNGESISNADEIIHATKKYVIHSNKTAILSRQEFKYLSNLLSNRVLKYNANDAVLGMLKDMGYDTVIYKSGGGNYEVVVTDPATYVEGEHTKHIKETIEDRIKKVKEYEKLYSKTKAQEEVKEQKTKNKQQEKIKDVPEEEKEQSKKFSLMDVLKFSEPTEEAEQFIKENKIKDRKAMSIFDTLGAKETDTGNYSEAEIRSIESIKDSFNLTPKITSEAVSSAYKVNPVSKEALDKVLPINYDDIKRSTTKYDVIGELQATDPQYINSVNEKKTAFILSLKEKNYPFGDDLSEMIDEISKKNPIAADALIDIFSRGEPWNINVTGKSYIEHITSFLRSKGIKDIIWTAGKEDILGATNKYYTAIGINSDVSIPFHELSHRYISDATSGLFGNDTMMLVKGALQKYKEEDIAGLVGYYNVKRQYNSALDNLSEDAVAYQNIQNGSGSLLDYVKVLSRKMLYEDYRLQQEKISSENKRVLQPLSIAKTIEYTRTISPDIGVEYAKKTVPTTPLRQKQIEDEQRRLSSAFYSAKQVRDAIREGFERLGLVIPHAYANNYFAGYSQGTVFPSPDDLLAPADPEKMFGNLIQLNTDVRRNVVIDTILTSPKLRSLIKDIEVSYGLPGRYLAKVSKRFFEVRDGFIGRFYNEVIDSVNSLNVKERTELYNILTKEKELGITEMDIPDRLRPAYETIRKMLDQVAYHHRAYNMPIEYYNPRTGRKELRHMDEFKQYFPDIINTKVIDEIVRNPYGERAEQYKKDFIDYSTNKYIEKGMDKDKAISLAEEIYNRIAKSSATGQRLARGITGEYGALREQMGVGLPESWKVKDLAEVMQRYTLRVAHDMALHNVIQVDPIAREILGIGKDPWGKKNNIKEQIESYNKIAPAIDKFIEEIKNANPSEKLSMLKSLLETLGRDNEKLLFYDEVVPELIRDTPIKGSYTDKELNTIDLLHKYLLAGKSNMDFVGNLLKDIKELNTPNVQLLLRFLYRDITHTEATFHSATSFVKSIMIGVKAKVRDVFNNMSLMAGYSNVGGKDLLRFSLSTAKFLMDGTALEQAINKGFIRQGGVSSVQEFSHYIQENGGDLTRILTTLRDLALRCTGTDKLEEFSRAFATSMAMSSVHINLINARNGSGRTQSNAIRFIEYYTGEKFNPNKRYTPDEISMAAIRLAQQTQGTYDARDLPSWLLEHSFTSAMFTLTKWNVSQTNRYVDAVLRNKTGSSIKMILGNLIGGAVGMYLMEELFGKKSNIADFKDIYTAIKEKNKFYGATTRDYVRLGFESQYSLTAMLQWSGYAGILSDVFYSINSVLKKQLPNTYGSPLYEQLTTVLDSTIDMVSAIKEGENPFIVGKDFTFDLLRTQVQTFNALISFIAAREKQMLPETARQLERSNLINEYYKYRRLQGYPQNDIVARSNKYENMSVRKFKQAETPQEAIKYFTSALGTTANKVVYPEQASRAMQGLASNAIPWSPTMKSSEGEINKEFIRYYDYIKERYGQDAAKDFYIRYMKTRAMNDYRRRLISGTPLGAVINR